MVEAVRPIQYSPFAYKELKVSVTSKINFLEDLTKQNQPLPKGMFTDWEEKEIKRNGRPAFSEWLRDFIENYMKD